MQQRSKFSAFLCKKGSGVRLFQLFNFSTFHLFEKVWRDLFLQPRESARAVPGSLHVLARGGCKCRLACLLFKHAYEKVNRPSPTLSMYA